MTQIPFRYKFYSSGNSIVVTIPSEIIDALKVKDGDDAIIVVDDLGRIVIEKKKARSN